MFFVSIDIYAETVLKLRSDIFTIKDGSGYFGKNKALIYGQKIKSVFASADLDYCGCFFKGNTATGAKPGKRRFKEAVCGVKVLTDEKINIFALICGHISGAFG